MSVGDDVVERALREYHRDAQAYFPHDTEGWIIGQLLTKKVIGDALTMEFMLSTGQKTAFEGSLSQLAKSDFAELPPLKNPDLMDMADDLAQLSYLHDNKNIYTYSGIVLIAMNPFERLDLYSPEIMREYAGKNREDLDPHLFAIAEEAYRAMLRGRNQSIIVSGESGAGKTQSTKYIMRYFATVDSLSKINDVEALMRPERVAKASAERKSEIEEAVLATNPILESFGNAKTTRNDNSSRFGKFIEIFFSTPQPGNSFAYLNQGKAGIVKTIDDVGDFEATQKALSTIGMSVTQQWKIFRICAALLHIGNIKIAADSGGNPDKCEVSESDPALVDACRLLQLDREEFLKWLTTRKIITGKETFLKSLKVDMAVVVRDSVAKFIYMKLFDCFEHFETNSFEQFCINYANEKLQQEFNSHVFRLEQELYMREQIVWTMIDFNDNQPCIDLIEGRLGILDILDEETRLPAGSDSSFLTKLNSRFAGGTSAHRYFSKPRFGQGAFTVRHYAVDVTYTAEGFLEKNRDSVSPEQHEVLSASTFDLLKEVIAEEEEAAPAPQTTTIPRTNTLRGSKKPTLGSMFKASLVQLMDTIRQTESHVRDLNFCIL
ncbi:Myosin type-2 heavy chain 1 [Cladochytrium tenue]|nr:Myosin type-2 heavy chain 1 [Cladochytrium tenue]